MQHCLDSFVGRLGHRYSSGCVWRRLAADLARRLITSHALVGDQAEALADLSTDLAAI
jgi:hypothetical protein